MSTTAQHTIKEVLDALIGTIKTVRWTPAEPGSKPEPAFQVIRIFDSDNLAAAFRELLLSQQRICIVIPVNVDFVPESEGELQLYRRELSVGLVISDRVIGNRIAALFGDPGSEQGRRSNPGAYPLAELLAPAVIGELIENPGGLQVALQDLKQLTVNPDSKDEKLKNLPGRAAVVLQIVCRGGTIEARQASPGPIV